MNLIGEKVYHKVFKSGVITQNDDKCIYVKFSSQSEEKRFIYPDCFKSFLKLENSDAENNVAQDSAKISEENRLKKEAERARIESLNISKHMNSKSTNRGRSIQNTEVPSFFSVDEFVDYYSYEIIKEIAYLRENGGKRVTVFDGSFLEKKGLKYFYAFETDAELNYQDGTKIVLYIPYGTDNEIKVEGILENSTENTVRISTEYDLGHSKDTEINSLVFSVEAWLLLSSLHERLAMMKRISSPIAKELITQGHNNIQYGRRIITGQDTAVEMAVDQPITFVWGPPGTGKTETLGKIAIEHIKLGHKILMMSYSNVSVDGALQRVYKLKPSAPYGEILRYGYPKDPDIINSTYKSSYNYALSTRPDLVKQMEKIFQSIKSVKKGSTEYIKIQNELSSISNEIKEQEMKLLKEAKFIATTVSKAVVDKRLTEIPFDVVIFDEASMSYIPQIVFGANLARHNFICMGDFCQLPPIVQGNHSEGLTVDIFKFCGISNAVESNSGHNWLCMLDTQYRMHPEIAEVASISMYHGLLKTGFGIREKRDELKKSVPELDRAYGMADLSYMMSTCVPLKDHSRVNILSAFISFALAQRAAGNNYDVGIIAPYSSQAGLLRCMAIDLKERNHEKDSIPCATVHQFQGSEKDVIIYDSTDCYRQTFPGVMLISKKDNFANKLFNVAMTRAKGKFVLVTNSKYMIDKGVKNDLMFGRVVQQSRISSQIDSKILMNLNSEKNSCQKFYIDHNASNDFFNDIINAKKRINIDIPYKPEQIDDFYSRLVDVIKKKKLEGVNIVIRAEKRASIPSILLPFTIEYSFVMNPVAVIDKSITWYGIPYSLAEFKTEDGIISTKYYPVIRFEGEKTARKIYGLIEMNKTNDQSIELLEGEEVNTFAQYVLKNHKCSFCGKPMRLKKGKKLFISCTGYPACSNTEFISTDLLTKYIYRNNRTGLKCAKCGFTLEAKRGRYGVYIQCCGLQKHSFKPDEI